MSERRVQQTLAMQELRVWVTGLLSEGVRLKKTLRIYFAKDNLFLPHMYQTFAESRLFIMALNQALVAAKLFAETAHGVLKEETIEAILAFERCCPDLRMLRNAIAHQDEYILGKGALQRTKIPTIEYTLGSSEIGIRYADDAPIIRIDIDDAVIATAKMGNAIEKAFHKTVSDQSNVRPTYMLHYNMNDESDIAGGNFRA